MRRSGIMNNPMELMNGLAEFMNNSMVCVNMLRRLSFKSVEGISVKKMRVNQFHGYD